MNKVTIIGRVAKDIEPNYTKDNKCNVSLSVAVPRTYKDAKGNTPCDFINVSAWGNQADFISRYVSKGNQIAVVGRLQVRDYDGTDGKKHYITEVLVESVENLTPRDKQEQRNEVAKAPNVDMNAQQNAGNVYREAQKQFDDIEDLDDIQNAVNEEDPF